MKITDLYPTLILLQLYLTEIKSGFVVFSGMNCQKCDSLLRNWTLNRSNHKYDDQKSKLRFIFLFNIHASLFKSYIVYYLLRHSSCKQFNMHDFLEYSVDNEFMLKKLNKNIKERKRLRGPFANQHSQSGPVPHT